MRTKELGEGTAFGELALMYGDKRTATVIAEEECFIYGLDGATFKNVIVRQSLETKNVSSALLDEFDELKKVDIFEKTSYLEGL